MKTIKIARIVILFLILRTVAYAQNSYSIDELDQFIKTERLCDRVISIRLFFGNNGCETITAIATQKGIVVIDGGMNPPVTEKYRKIIEKEFKRNDFAYILTTHADLDHTFGDRIFPEATILGHDMMKKELVTRWGDAAKRPTFAE